MNCPKCGAVLKGGESVCGNCGERFAAPVPIEEKPAAPVVPAAVPVKPAAPAAPVAQAAPVNPTAPVYRQTPVFSREYKPLSPWAYFGYTILFSIPIIGFIFLIAYSFDKSNINRRNFARSFWIPILLAVILMVVFLILSFVFGFSMESAVEQFKNYV